MCFCFYSGTRSKLKLKHQVKSCKIVLDRAEFHAHRYLLDLAKKRQSFRRRINEKETEIKKSTSELEKLAKQLRVQRTEIQTLAKVFQC